MDSPRPRSVVIVAVLMIVFGLAEIVTGFTHNFAGLHTAARPVATYLGAGVGACYASAGLVTLAMKRWAAILAVALLLCVIAGRISLVVTNLYPVSTFKQAAAVLLGTAIAAGFAIFIVLRKSAFR